MLNNKKPKYRHEIKYIISDWEKQAMMQRLHGIMKKDANGGVNGYTIRSLYFDDYWYKAYEEKMIGTFHRKKYRIRIYDFSDKVIKLECKEKQGNYIYKQGARLSREETDMILNGQYDFLLNRKESLCHAFYLECMTKGLRPAVIVDYEREAFVLKEGDVRITFDDHVRSAWMGFDIFDKDLPAYGVLEPSTLILEVKYTEFLPEFIRRNVSPNNSQLTAASKYTMCLEKKREITR